MRKKTSIAALLGCALLFTIQAAGAGQPSNIAIATAA